MDVVNHVLLEPSLKGSTWLAYVILPIVAKDLIDNNTKHGTKFIFGRHKEFPKGGLRFGYSSLRFCSSI